MLKINAIGDVCPVPVIKAKNALKEMKPGEILLISVDNMIATENLAKMAGELGYNHSLNKIEDKNYEVTIIKGEARADDNTNSGKIRGENTVVAIGSSFMGAGDSELGAALMKGFLYALTELDTPPATLLFYNGGAKLSVETSQSVEDLKKLEEKGVEILTCGTCLNFYGLTDTLAIGGVTNMYTIVEKLSKADKVIKP